PCGDRLRLGLPQRPTPWARRLGVTLGRTAPVVRQLRRRGLPTRELVVTVVFGLGHRLEHGAEPLLVRPALNGREAMLKDPLFGEVVPALPSVGQPWDRLPVRPGAADAPAGLRASVADVRGRRRARGATRR